MTTLHKIEGYCELELVQKELDGDLLSARHELLGRPVWIKRFHTIDTIPEGISSLIDFRLLPLPTIYDAFLNEAKLTIVAERREGERPLIGDFEGLDPLKSVESLAAILSQIHGAGLSYLGLNLHHIWKSKEGSLTLSPFGFGAMIPPEDFIRSALEEDSESARLAYAFLSPEQKGQDQKRPDELHPTGSDWFSLGILYHFLKEGALPDVGSPLSDPIFAALVDPDPSKRHFGERSSSDVHSYKPQKQSHRSVDPLETPMISISEGMYARGSKYGPRDEMPRHSVKLSDFMIDIHPVTNEQFVRFLMVVGDARSEGNQDYIRFKDSRLSKTQSGLHIETGYAKHPVVGVTWYGAMAYAKWAGKELPTEAQWEAAAGSGSALYPTGEQVDKKMANFFNNDTTAVMSYPPGQNELYDMAGNVYEWCRDWYDFHAYDMTAHEPRDPEGPRQGVYRVLRGGCWKSLEDDLRTAHRHRNNPGACEATYGFRCVKRGSK